MHVTKLGHIPDDSEDEEQADEKRPALKATETDDEDSESTTSSSTYTRFSDLTKREWLTIGMLAIANLCSTVAFSCIAPFYPVSL